MRAVEYLEQPGKRVRQAALEHESMQAAVGRHTEGVPARDASGRTPRRTGSESRMLRHLVIRERHPEQGRHAGARPRPGPHGTRPEGHLPDLRQQHPASPSPLL